MRRLLVSALCFLLGIAALRAQAPEQVKATVAYLRSLQTDGGGFTARATSPASKEPNPPSLRATSGSLRALKYLGGEPKDREAAKRFVARCFDKATGGFADAPGGKPDVATTAVGLMALVELKMPLGDYGEPAIRYLGENAKTFEDIRIAAAGVEAAGKRPPQADSWLKQVADMRGRDGLYGKDDGHARDTGGAVVVVLRLGSKVENADAIAKALRAGQRRDGGFGKANAAGSDMETTYRVMRAFVMLKERPREVNALQEFIGRCRNDDGGYGLTPDQPSSAGGTYYAAIIRHWLEKP